MRRLSRQLEHLFETWIESGRGAWLVFAIPGLYQVWLFGRAVWGRFGYGYDLEWMESGMLSQALRVANGHPPYNAPSADFIAHLYSPLYSIVMAALSPIFGISYQVGRGISVLSIAAIFGLIVWAARQEASADGLHVAVVSASVGAGIWALGYPFTDGWYDLVRVDSMMCATVGGALVGLRADPVGDAPTTPFVYPRTALWAALLATGFFVKQTAIFFVAAGGAAVLLIERRALPTYILTAAVVGFGGIGILQWWTDGWAWTYMYEYHQHHGSSSRQFWNAFGTLWEVAPAAWILVAVAASAALLRLVFADGDRRTAKGTLYWCCMLAVGVLAGAVGMSTRWAVRNALMPAIFLLSIAAAVSLVAVARWTRQVDVRLHRAAFATMLTLLGVFLVGESWSPAEFVPSPKDSRRGRSIVRIMENVEGPIFAPFFPWYPHLAGKDVQVHQMGMNDVRVTRDASCAHKSGLSRWICPKLEERASRVAGLRERLQAAEYGAVFTGRWDSLRRFLDEYRRAGTLQRIGLSRPPTGRKLKEIVMFEREVPSPNPDRGRVLFDDFESPRLPDWELDGSAWGSGPVTSRPRSQNPVGGYLGSRFMDSYHGTDSSKGTALSPTFTLKHPTMHFRVGGGKKPDGARIELRNDKGEVIRSATGHNSDMLRPVTWELDEHVGETLRIVLIDDSSSAGGHLLVDAIYTTE